MATNIAKNAPMVMAALQKNIFEHISTMAAEHIQLEFKNEIQQMQMMQQQMQAQPNPQAQQMMQQQMQQLNIQIEARKAEVISEAMEEFAKEEQKISSQFANDPIAQLKSRELDLIAQDNERKKIESEEKANLEKMKAMMNQLIQDEKLKQNEELANLRADTSIHKTVLAAHLKKDGEKNKK